MPFTINSGRSTITAPEIANNRGKWVIQASSNAGITFWYAIADTVEAAREAFNTHVPESNTGHDATLWRIPGVLYSIKESSTNPVTITERDD